MRPKGFIVLAVMAVIGGLIPSVTASGSTAAVTAQATAPAVAEASSGGSPNFVVVVTDDQRWDTIGRCLPDFDGSDYTAGDDSCMPQVADKLVANGTTFLRGEVHQSLCCPTRATLLTGQYSRHTGVTTLDGARFDDSSSMATWLDAAGYRTGLFGKYLNGYGAGTLLNYIPPGWDDFHSFHGYNNQTNPYSDYEWIDWSEGDPAPVITDQSTSASTSELACADGNWYSTDLICNLGLDFLSTDQTVPFFLYLAPASPHTPNTAASRHVGVYASVESPSYPSHNVVPSPNPPAYLPTQPLSVSALGRAMNLRGGLESNRAADDMVGAVYDQLVADGRVANTVWVFISDNGAAAGEHRLTGKQCPYIECHRVPFIVVCPPAVCPGTGAGVRDATNYALSIDVAPTIADLAGVTPSLRMDGHSLVPILENPQASWRTEWLLFDHDIPIDGMVAKAADGDWYKYLVLQDTGETQLFNLIDDPWELTNLWNNSAVSSIQADLADRLSDATTDPVLTITSQPPASSTATTATITYTASESVDFTCARNGAAATACGTGNAGTVTYTALTTGTHTVVVEAVDSWNNVATATVTFTVTASGGGGGDTFTLTATKAGTGTGTVRSTPAGIKCGTDCTEGYTSGTAVTLTAKPARGSTFTGWSGACTGTGSCVVTVTAATTVTATFTSTG
ncbi:MAG: sulfatase-like hydrolase/transferase [Actinomycetota bacterium]|nr:sulfatase-like hydrolase/transferase [Actinomycetota bacterium]